MAIPIPAQLIKIRSCPFCLRAFLNALMTVSSCVTSQIA